MSVSVKEFSNFSAAAQKSSTDTVSLSASAAAALESSSPPPHDTSPGTARRTPPTTSPSFMGPHPATPERAAAARAPAAEVRRPRHLDRAEGRQVRGHPLHVEQPPVHAVGGQQLDQADQRHLRRVADPVEHRLAREQPADPHAVQPAGELAVAPRLDRVRPAQPVQLAVRRGDVAGDPPASRAGSPQRPRPRRTRCRPGSRSPGTSGAGTARRPARPAARSRDASARTSASAAVRRSRASGRSPGGTPPAGSLARGRRRCRPGRPRRRAGPGRPTGRVGARPARTSGWCHRGT